MGPTSLKKRLCLSQIGNKYYETMTKQLNDELNKSDKLAQNYRSSVGFLTYLFTLKYTCIKSGLYLVLKTLSPSDSSTDYQQ